MIIDHRVYTIKPNRLNPVFGDLRAPGAAVAAKISTVAARCLTDPDSHNGKTYRLGAEVRSYDEIAGIMSEVVTALRV
jgi:uncharacterized protein YbjT (DUF2867 family)